MDIDPKELHSVLSVLEYGQDEQKNIERSIGQGFLALLSGKKASLDQAYAGLGGKDPVVSMILSAMNYKFNTLNLKSGSKRVTEVVNSPEALRAAKAVATRTAAQIGMSAEACCNTTIDLAAREDHYVSTLANFATPATLERMRKQ